MSEILRCAQDDDAEPLVKHSPPEDDQVQRHPERSEGSRPSNGKIYPVTT